MFTEKTFVGERGVTSYAEGPTSGPPLVFLHGIAGSWQEYKPFFRSFAAAWHVHACDLRGHGRSSRAAGTYQLADYASDIVMFLRRRIQAPAVLVGHSLGAMTALATAVVLPLQVRALVLLDPPLPSGELRMNDYPDLEQFLAWMRDQAASAQSVDEVMAAYREVAADADEASLWRESWSIFHVAPAALDVALNSQLLGGFDLRRALAQVTCPLLLLYGDAARGAIVRAEDATFVRSVQPEAVIVGIPGAGHMLHAEQPEPVLWQIEDFLRSLPVMSAAEAS
jgi:pimeloyl-ACP methyl ester carboxylesterase